MTIAIKNKQIVIDGQPRIILSGEVHYFRLKRSEWQDRITKLKEAGCNTVASYIPWLCHEQHEGQVDLTGKTRPELDLGAFIDLCKENGLYFIARPGPFVMAELKNEGLPFWLYTKHPEIVPLTWDAQQIPTHTVDYLAHNFLQEVHHWYSHVMSILAPRLHHHGGNIIAVQLDNEVGMLSWVSNSPDLTSSLLATFADWLHQQYSPEELKKRYPFSMDKVHIRDTRFRSPNDEYATPLLHDLGYYMRERFARYIATLHNYAEEFGVSDVPFLINIHGTGEKGGTTFPIGISQLYEAYTQSSDYVAGSDHYLGELQISNFQDLYLINAFMSAVNLPDQPLTSVEFECGDGDYSGSDSSHHDPSTIDFKVRMCIAQGNRVLNYYLFSGGINPLLSEPVDDGNNRIAFTGERHGFAAPINPEGKINYSYWPLAKVNKAVSVIADKAALMDEEHDAVSFAFIPDYYMTESYYPGSARMTELVKNLEVNRAPDAWGTVARAMLLAGYRFGAHDIQHQPLDAQQALVLVVPSARYMNEALQDKLVSYLQAGGHMLLYGEVPLFNMEGKPAQALATALGLNYTGTRQSSSSYFLSLQTEDWVAPRPEVRTQHAHFYENASGKVLLRAADTAEACGFDIQVSSGRAVVITAAYPCDISFYRTILEQLGAQASLDHHYEQNGIFMTSSTTPDGERLLHMLNLDGFEKEVYVTEHGEPLLGTQPFTLRRREGVMLPLNVLIDNVRIVYSTAEIVGKIEGGIEFRLTQTKDVIAIESSHTVVPSIDYDVEKRGNIQIITSRKPSVLDDRLLLCLETYTYANKSASV